MAQFVLTRSQDIDEINFIEIGIKLLNSHLQDVAVFLGVAESGLKFFDARYRPVPLSQTFIGLTERNTVLIGGLCPARIAL